jgi:hypothetical protein
MAVLFGDTSGSLTGRQHGAAQTLVGSDPTNTLFGDAGEDLLGRAIGGNDTLLTSGSGSLYGDAGGNISDHARGGSDTLSAQVSAPAIIPGETFSLDMYVMLEATFRTGPLRAMTCSMSNCPWPLRPE